MDIIEHIVSENGVKKDIMYSLINNLNGKIKSYFEELGVHYTCVFDTSFNCEFFIYFIFL